MNSSLDKRPTLTFGITSKATAKSNIKPEQLENMSTIDIEKENRLSKIISLFSKGLTQSEIAQELNVDQSTISRDLQFLKQEAKGKIEKYLNEDILFEYLRYIAGSNEVTRHLWEIVQDQETITKDKTNALSLLMQFYNKRLELLIGGPESYMKAKKSVSEIKYQEKVDSDPFLKMLSERNKLRSESPFGKNKHFKF
jgi:transcriptional regulator with XRE-family HTH domain